jgi:peptide/nickel transport system substrate-binding protein
MPRKRFNTVRGELVERWEIKKNPPSVVFHLRKGVMWQEKPDVMKAREFVADDVVYSMMRLLNSRKAIATQKSFSIGGRPETNIPWFCT